MRLIQEQKEFHEVFRSIMLEEFQEVVREFTKTQELQYLLTRTEIMTTKKHHLRRDDAC